MLDTDVCVDHLRRARQLPPSVDGAAYSVITRCELFAGREEDERHVARFLDRFVEFPLERAIAERAGRLRHELRLTLPDAIVAATALDHALTLVTRNRRDFEQVVGLRLRDPAILASP